MTHLDGHIDSCILFLFGLESDFMNELDLVTQVYLPNNDFTTTVLLESFQTHSHYLQFRFFSSSLRVASDILSHIAHM